MVSSSFEVLGGGSRHSRPNFCKYRALVFEIGIERLRLLLGNGRRENRKGGRMGTLGTQQAIEKQDK